ncbi:hypothetical protein BZB76_1520 [Actinomadura pelletieri DSM 43383]|uniref:Uncharacterized protein n=1 Tax=Actinomadura pelletieri DSM 43383 TaxID=1120940 RepID=A0A495QRP4_9ACTN|nr:hypothetical protein BZB76_1520 [Actinomadura pelletieri DSM 43383]
MYCKAFVSEECYHVVREHLSGILSADFASATAAIDSVEVEIRRNPDHVSSKRPTDKFLYWPIIVEIEDDSSVATSAMMGIASRVIIGLWKVDIPVVVACDFEQLLPWKGGIERVGNSG